MEHTYNFIFMSCSGFDQDSGRRPNAFNVDLSIRLLIANPCPDGVPEQPAGCEYVAQGENGANEPRYRCSFMAARYSACGRAFAHVGSVSGDTALLQSAPCEGGSRGLVRVLPNLSGI